MDVGAELRNARVAQRIDLPTLAARTRIRAGLIADIEDNDYHSCGGLVFARGHVRAIAMALGLDPTPLLLELGASERPTHIEAVEPESLNIWELRARSQRPSERRVWTVLGTVAALIVLGLVWQARMPSSDPALDASALPSVTATGKATVTPEPTPTESEPTPTESQPTTPPQETDAAVVEGAIVMTIESVEPSWVRASNDVGTLFEGTLQAGDSRTVSSDTPITVRIGNAAGITITVNGTFYDQLGLPGEVVTRTFPVP